jgi:hypothetical protein
MRSREIGMFNNSLSVLRRISIILLLLPASLAYAEEQPVISGSYDGMLVAYDKTSNRITGYFNEYTGSEASRFSCIFYFSGKLNGGKADIVSYFPENPSEDVIKGTLAFQGKGTLEVRLQEEHGGCWNVRHFADPQPATFNLQDSHPTWVAIEIIKSKKAYFYAEPNEGARKRSYVVQGNAVAVIHRSADWLSVEYTDGNQMTTGYIKKSDVYDLPR